MTGMGGNLPCRKTADGSRCPISASPFAVGVSTNALQHPVYLFEIERFGIKWSSQPLDIGLVFFMIRISESFEHPVITPCPANVFRWAGSLTPASQMGYHSFD